MKSASISSQWVDLALRQAAEVPPAREGENLFRFMEQLLAMWRHVGSCGVNGWYAVCLRATRRQSIHPYPISPRVRTEPF